VGDGSAGTWISTGDWNSSLYLGPKLYRLEAATGGVEVRAKGVPRDKAEQYIETGQATYQTSLSVREAIQRGLPAGTWVEAVSTQRHIPGARTIHDPLVLREKVGYSPTSPVVFASNGDGTTTLTNDTIPS